MSLAILHSRATTGIAAPPVTIEVHLANGFPHFNIVGLPETAVKESKHRVRSAIINSQFKFPVKRITVNLAPADLPKEGGRFDLAIALGILAASKQIPDTELQHYEIAGELALSGALRPIKGILPFALHTASTARALLIAEANAEEAALAENTRVFAAKHLLDVCSHLTGHQRLGQQTPLQHISQPQYLDLTDVYGQTQARRALEIAAAGHHNLLMSGPPGTGKTMLASRLISILPPLSLAQAQTTAALYSISHLGFKTEQWRQRPFRAPHHTSSSVALVGGGRPPTPGEISLAQHGVLFLDELPEFNRHVLECLREPIESGKINISRASHQVQYPAEFQLVAAMNPCPCGYLTADNQRCQCTSDQVQRYRQKISGPLLDRIDLHIEISKPPPLFFNNTQTKPESSAHVCKRVSAAQALQLQRQQQLNAHLDHNKLLQHCPLQDPEKVFLHQAIDRLALSARAYTRIIKIARTIADLEHKDAIQRSHLQEALSYRTLDRQTH